MGMFPGTLDETFAACEEYIVREMGALFDKYMARMDAREAENRKDDVLLEECLKEMNRIADFGVRKIQTDPEATAPPASPFP